MTASTASIWSPRGSAAGPASRVITLRRWVVASSRLIPDIYLLHISFLEVTIASTAGVPFVSTSQNEPY
jgi:hypothetical protein